MIDRIPFKKLKYHYKKDGLAGATEAVTNHFQTRIEKTLEGTSCYYNLRLSLLSRKYSKEDLTPIWISPDEITLLTGSYRRLEDGHLDYVTYFKPQELGGSLPYEEEAAYGEVRGGEWDIKRVPFSKLFIYRGIEQRFNSGEKWEETVYYNELLNRFLSNGWSKQDAKKLTMSRCTHIEEVYETLKSDGYRSQKELGGHPLHEVTVNIARDGKLLYNSEGRHRLSIAKILGIKKIPVLVLVRHEAYGDKGTDRYMRTTIAKNRV